MTTELKAHEAPASYVLEMPHARPGYKQTEVGVIPKDWEVKRLGDIAEIRDGTHQTPNYVKSGVPFFSVENVTSGDFTNTKFISEEEHRFLTKSFKIEKNDILMTRIGSIGDCKLIDWDVDASFYVSLALLKIRNGYSASYICHYSNSAFFKKEVELNSLQSAIPRKINLGPISNVRVEIPGSIKEQEAIAAVLSDVDALLAKLDQFIAKKRDLKQAAMQQLLTGSTRLPGFSGEWEVKRLGDVGTCLRGVSYRGDSDLSAYDTESTKRLLRSNNVQDAAIVTTDIQFVNSERVSEKQLLREHDILICMANGSKALVGKAGFFTVSDGHEYTFGAFMGCFRSSTADANATFIFYLFQTGRYRNYINNLLAGSSINNLTPTSIESLEFPVPPIPEQTAIATILSDMDAEIAALEAKLVKVRQVKQGMMQELLTGRIRLV
jgi:type I restriction enzyme S subunit